MIEGAADGASDSGAAEERAEAQLARLRADGARAKDAVAQVVATTGLSRSRVYRLWLETKK